jgi:hypothetical protein
MPQRTPLASCGSSQCDSAERNDPRSIFGAALPTKRRAAPNQTMTSRTATPPGSPDKVQVCYWICKAEESYPLPLRRGNIVRPDIALTQWGVLPQIDKSQSLCLLHCSINQDV